VVFTILEARPAVATYSLCTYIESYNIIYIYTQLCCFGSIHARNVPERNKRSIASERNLWNDGIVLSPLRLSLRYFTAGGILYPPPETYVYYQNKAPILLK
jgi:hypothetical protein